METCSQFIHFHISPVDLKLDKFVKLIFIFSILLHFVQHLLYFVVFRYAEEKYLSTASV